MMNSKLDELSIREALSDCLEWHYLEDDELEAVYEFESFPQSVEFLNIVADLSEEINHHPKIILNYNKLTLRLRTHDQECVTDLDVHLAIKIAKAFQKFNQLKN